LERQARKPGVPKKRRQTRFTKHKKTTAIMDWHEQRRKPGTTKAMTTMRARPLDNTIAKEKVGGKPTHFKKTIKTVAKVF